MTTTSTRSLPPFLRAATLLICAAAASVTLTGQGANPASTTMTVTSSPVTFTGTAAATGSANGESTCNDGVSCDNFTITLGGTVQDWTSADKRVEVRITPPSSTDDYDLYIHKSTPTGPLVDNSGNGPGVEEVAHINPAKDGVGTFDVHVVYFASAPTHQYQGKASVVAATTTPAPPAPQDNGPPVGYEIFETPNAYTTTVQANANTTEYLGRTAGEPSIGVNLNSPSDPHGVTNFQSDLQTLFVTFDDSCPVSGKSSTWVNRPAPTQQAIDSDPIGFTSAITGRAYAGELTATSPGCKISYTDNDGATWVATTGPAPAAIDHETIGGGPYHTINGVLPPSAYAGGAFYYCSQDLATAYCLRSDDGGASWLAQQPMYTTECGGLHGHVKVSPKEGTVYVPNASCGGSAAVAVSEDNGTTWRVRNVVNATTATTTSGSDPAVGIDKNGRVYFANANNGDTSLVVATSDDFGSSWQQIYDVTSALGIKGVRYPAAVGGDGGRAAIAFLGTKTASPAGFSAAAFKGSWHLYIAHTFDGGASWSVTDATPNMPMQRGCIWNGGGANICRNLLDFFDIAFDKQGRVQVGFANGCTGASCAQAPEGVSGNAYSSAATIARQSSGRRLLAASDPATTAQAPGMPFVTARRVGTIAHVAWSEGDTGNSALTGYQVLRGTASGAESFLAQVGPDVTTYDDLTATDLTKTYYYKVVAMNAMGTSCGNNEVAAPYVGDTCPGIATHRNDPTHNESASVSNGANPQLAIDYVAVREPLDLTKPAGNPNLVFTMKVSNLATIPPDSRWRIVWDSYSSSGQQFYVGMTSDSTSVVTYEYGEIATAVVGLVVGVPQETKKGTATGSYNVDGTITLTVPRSAVGNPAEGSLLGAVNGRTFTGDTSQTKTLERSTALIDHTFVKAQTDNSFPGAAYMMRDLAHLTNNHVPVATVSATCGGPTCSANGPPVYGNPPLNVTFTGTYADVDGDSPGAYRVDFGDTTAATTKSCGAFPTPNNTCATIAHSYAASGYFTAQLTNIDDCGLASDPVTVQIHVNGTPVAAAGDDFSVAQGQTAMLSGVGSSDPDNDPLTYSWAQTAGPGVTLSGADTASPTFVAPAVTTATPLTFKLTVTDPLGLSASDSVTVTVTPNFPPVADAGTDFTADEKTLVHLDGTASHDPEGGPLTFAWAQTSGPGVTLSGADTATPSFTAPTATADTPLTFKLTVTDPIGQTAAASVTVTITHVNIAPVVNAGPDVTVDEKKVVVMAGSATDADGDPLTLIWTQVSGPTVAMQGATTTAPHFTAPNVNGDTAVVLRLMATDSHGAKATDDVTVTIRDLDMIGNAHVGALPAGSLLLLGLAGLARRRRRR